MSSLNLRSILVPTVPDEAKASGPIGAHQLIHIYFGAASEFIFQQLVKQNGRNEEHERNSFSPVADQRGTGPG